MAFWPDVTRGDKVKHYVLLENNIRQMVNALDGFGGGTARSPGCGVVRIQVWNASDEALMAGCPVAFDADKGMVGGAVPAVRVCDASKPFGVLQAALAPRAMGGCIVAGPAVVPIDGGSGEYAEPVMGGDGFAYSGSGTARVLCANGGTAVVLLGVGTSDTYDGPFAIRYDGEAKKVRVKAGYSSLNCGWRDVAEAELDPEDGYLCVHSDLGDLGEWTEPVVRYAEPGQYDYPIGRTTVGGSADAPSVSVVQCRVPVAIIMAAAECPISARLGDA